MLKILAPIGNTKSYSCNNSGLFIRTLKKVGYSTYSEETSHLNLKLTRGPNGSNESS